MNTRMSEFQVNLSEQDEVALKDYLASFDFFAGREQEGIDYINHAFRRFIIALEMVPSAVSSDSKLLELGAAPYFITLLLLRFRNYRMTLANFFRKGQAPNGQGIQVISSLTYNERHEFAYDHFNVEIDTFPYPDNEFDMVLFCEILEHLTMDPTHALCEIHRVLKPGGLLLVTTPNVLAWQNLWKLSIGQNIYDQYSGYGVYGRHNREYTPLEVIQLLQVCGFEYVSHRLHDLCVRSRPVRLLKKLRQHWRDHIFVMARASGCPRYVYPSTFYRSTNAILRIVSPEIRIGEYDEAQLGEGWYSFDSTVRARWTSQVASAYLLRRQNETSVGLEVNGFGASLGEVTLSVHAASSVYTFQFSTDEWKDLKVPLPYDFADDQVEVRLVTNPTRRLLEMSRSTDNPVLGVLVRRIWLG